MDQNKTTLAKLLATENISVVQAKVRTAMFDVKNRVLTLPMWTDVSKFTEDHLIGHEVGHALYTPLDGWHDAVCARGNTYKSYLNVVEDARIEKLIQRKYPGLRSSFIKSYRALLADGFFGADLSTINSMGLIDRINTYFKCGQSAGVEFAESELTWLDRIAGLETWDSVVALTDELFEFCKEEQKKEEEKRAQQQEEEDAEERSEHDDDEDGSSDDSDDEEFGDEFGDEEDASGGDVNESDEGEEEDGDESASTSEGEESDEEGESEDKFTTRSGGQYADEDNDIRSRTDEILRDSIDKEVYKQFDGEVYNLEIMDLSKNYQNYIISNARVIEEIDGVRPLENALDMDEHDYNRRMEVFKMRDTANIMPIGNALFREWMRTNKKTVSHMVKEFEMRKSATEFQRTGTAKTGTIDTIKMNNYKLTDDIFRKITTVPEGKNHAFIMMLDMSGSMFEQMYETIEQTLLLVHFCRQIGVPFRVFGFSDVTCNRWSGTERVDIDKAGVMYPDCGKLIEFFSDKQSKSNLQKVASMFLAAYAHGITSHNKQQSLYKVVENATGIPPYKYRNLVNSNLPHAFDLGGTPMDSCIMILAPFARDYRKSTRVDVLHTFFLTDGVSHEAQISGMGSPRAFVRPKNHVTLRNPYTGKVTTLRDHAGAYRFVMTPALLNFYRETTGSTVIGFFIERNSARAIRNTLDFLDPNNFQDRTDEISNIRREGFGKVNAVGYDELYLLTVKSLQIVENKMDEVEAGELTKAKLRTVFKKQTLGANKSRVMLTDLMQRVA